jgi:hypothetical protein
MEIIPGLGGAGENNNEGDAPHFTPQGHPPYWIDKLTTQSQLPKLKGACLHWPCFILRAAKAPASLSLGQTMSQMPSSPTAARLDGGPAGLFARDPSDTSSDLAQIARTLAAPKPRRTASLVTVFWNSETPLPTLAIRTDFRGMPPEAVSNPSHRPQSSHSLSSQHPTANVCPDFMSDLLARALAGLRQTNKTWDLARHAASLSKTDQPMSSGAARGITRMQ